MTKDFLTITRKARSFDFHKIITFDTEALRVDNGLPQNAKGYSEDQTFFNVDLYDGNEHYYTEDLLKFNTILFDLLQKYKKITLLCHNAKYDFQILKLLDNFIKTKKLLGLERKRMILGNVNYVKFASKNGNMVIQFLDSTNYFKVPLSELGKAIGIEKFEVDKYKLSAKEWNKDLKQNGKERAKSDTEILYQFFTEFIKMDLTFGITSASTAFNTFRKKWLKIDISLPVELIDPALKSYRGARVEPYKFYPEPVQRNYYDINSLYPYVMSKHKYSIKLRRKLEINEISLENMSKGTYNYLIKCNYQYQDRPLRIPIVVKNTDNDRLIQAYSGKEVWLTGREILRMTKENVLIEFLEGYEFFAEYLFTDYVNYYYKLRKETTNEVWNLFYKLGMLNSLYGKFGQHKRFSEYKSIDELDELERIAYLMAKGEDKEEYIFNGRYCSIHDGFITFMAEMPLEKMYNPLIASEITANARLYNYEVQQQIGFENVDYTDTDSFMTDRILEESKALGGLKLEMSGEFRYYDAKDYEYYGICTHKDCPICHNKMPAKMPAMHTTLKGIRKDAIYDKESNSYIQKQFSSLKTSEYIGTVKVMNISKELKRKRVKLHYVKDSHGVETGYPYDSQDTNIEPEIRRKKR